MKSLDPQNDALYPQMTSLDPQNDVFRPAKQRIYSHKMTTLVDSQNDSSCS